MLCVKLSTTILIHLITYRSTLPEIARVSEVIIMFYKILLYKSLFIVYRSEVAALMNVSEFRPQGDPNNGIIIYIPVRLGKETFNS